MKTWVKYIGVLVLIAGLVIFTGAGGGSQAQEQKRYTFYMVVHGGIADPFWKVVEKGAKDADALYPDVDVIYTGPEWYDFEKFLSYVEAAIAAKPDGLLVTITSYAAMDEPLKKAIKEGLPVIAINAMDPRVVTKPAEMIPYLSYIGEDHYLVGVTAAKESLKRFTPKRAVFANHHPGAFHIEQRGAGFIDTIKKERPGIPVEALDVTAEPVRAASILVAYLKAHPDTDLIFSTNTLITEAFIPALEEAKVKVGPDGVRIAQVDMSPKVLDYILADKIMFTMDQQQYLQGYLSVVFMNLHVKYGFTPPSVVPTGPSVITKEDVPKVREMVVRGYR